MALEDMGELPAPPVTDELAYLQYTSGSTRFPRGTMITQASALHNLEAIFQPRLSADRRRPLLLLAAVLPRHGPGRHRAGMRRDAALLRLPGLARVRDAAAAVAEAHVAEPQHDFVQSAVRLRAVRTPPAAKDTESLDLSAWRVAGVGAEMIHPEWLNAFAEALAPDRVQANAFLPCYGMAECTLAVSFSPVGGGSQIDYVDGEHLSDTGEALPLPDDAPSRRKGFINCGAAAAGLRSRNPRRGRRTCCRSVSVGAYSCAARASWWVTSTIAEETTRVLTADGWLDTGDLGYSPSMVRCISPAAPRIC